MKIITQNEILKELKDGLEHQQKCVIVNYTESQVNYGLDDIPNLDYCSEHNIVCNDIGRRGGVFVINKGDIGFGYITKGCDNTIGLSLRDKFVEYLKSKNLNAYINNNDILVDGYKVFGWASNYYQNYDAIYITAHFTISVNLDLINAICTKPMFKVPKGLSEFNINNEDIIDFLTNCNIV